MKQGAASAAPFLLLESTTANSRIEIDDLRAFRPARSISHLLDRAVVVLFALAYPRRQGPVQKRKSGSRSTPSRTGARESNRYNYKHLGRE
jgi:hypothetical protein